MINIKKLIIGAAVTAAMFGAMVVPAFAAQPENSVLVNNWTVYNRSDVAPKVWWNYKATDLTGGGVGFEFNQESTSWYTAYLKAYYNGDLTDTTITANVSVTNGGATFVGRNGGTPSTVGLVIKSKVGNWGPNDYWFATNRVSLSALTTTGVNIIASTLEANRGGWINLDGRTALDNTTPWTSYLGEQKESPYDGFTNALKHVKEVGLSFSGATYASGVALTSGTESFQLNSFEVTP